jgi:hypothetical protein
MRKPNLFIVGMPKCGTTAMAEYLRQHPNIFMTTPKDINFFTKEVHPSYQYAKTIDDYMNLFKNCTAEHLVLGEASVRYCLYSESIKSIYEFNKNAKIIIMIRNPIDLAVSLHAMLVSAFDEDQNDFEKAWQLQHSRQKGENIPVNCWEPYFLQYSQIAKPGEKVERVLSIFPKEKVKIIVFDDFKLKTQSAYNEVLSFLGVSQDNRSKFPPHNIAGTPKFSWLARLTNRPPPLFYNLAIKVRKWTGIPYLGIGGVLNKIRVWNKKVFIKLPLRPEFRVELANEFSEDIEKLSVILNRDFSHWLSP